MGFRESLKDLEIVLVIRRHDVVKLLFSDDRLFKINVSHLPLHLELDLVCTDLIATLRLGKDQTDPSRYSHRVILNFPIVSRRLRERRLKLKLSLLVIAYDGNQLVLLTEIALLLG
jgi:hypothetical protein